MPRIQFRYHWHQQPPAGTPINLNHPQARGLVGMWMLNEGGGTTAFDSTGRGRHGTHVSAPGHQVGEMGRHLKFDGTDDKVQIGSIDEVNVASPEVTLCCWAKFVTIGSQWQALIESGNTELIFGPYSATTELMATCNGGSTNIFSGSGSITTTKWHHCVLTLDGANNGEIFIDGLSQTSGGVGALAFQNGQLELGNTVINWYDGSLADVRLYNRVLSDGEIFNLYTHPYAIFDRDIPVGVAAAAGPGPTAPANYPWTSMMGYGA